MSEPWENEVIRKKDLVNWIQKTASAYRQLQYLYRDRIDYGKEMTILCAVADHVRFMRPYDGKVDEKNEYTNQEYEDAEKVFRLSNRV